MLHMRSTALDQFSPIAHQGAEGADLGIRANGGPQQAQGVKLLEPLGIVPVALAPGHILDVAGMNEERENLLRFEQFVDRDPV
jgi:hypothetical protein